MKKYIIIDDDEGIFLGTAKNDEVELFDVPPGTKIVALFSSHNILDITKAVGFFTEEDAHSYIARYLKRFTPNCYVVPVEADDDDSPYVDTIDIVKAGYGEHAWDMIDALPMPSQYFH